MNKYEKALREEFELTETLHNENVIALQELVERATPKEIKPGHTDFYLCPVCFTWHGIYNTAKFCHYCGSAIKIVDNNE